MAINKSYSSNSLTRRIEQLENVVKLYDKQFVQFAVEIGEWNFKINLISGWISDRFGVDFPTSPCSTSEQIISSKSLNPLISPKSLNPSSDELKIRTAFITSESRDRFHHRFLRIKESIRKRRCSSLSQQSMISNKHSYLRERRSVVGSTFSKDECTKNSDTALNSIIAQDKKLPLESSVPCLRISQEKNNTQIRGVIVHTNELTTEKRVDNLSSLSKKDGQSISKSLCPTIEKVVEIDPTSTSIRKGRPKKRFDDGANTTQPKQKNRTPMVCDQCGKLLKGASSLRSHKLSHSNVRPYQCLLCPKAFRMKHHLDFHRLTHDDGEKKWTCRFCDKGFIAQRDLLRHERTHTGERPFPCTYPDCSKSFNVKQHLTLHIRTHTGERPYRCPICDKTFTQANSLRIHKKIHTKDDTNKEVSTDSKHC